MESKAHYALVGAAVLAAVAGLFFAILWVSGAAGKEGTADYTIYFKHHSLSGLQVDSDVTMKGIRVGRVESFQLSPVDIERVKVRIQIGEETPVKNDTEAIIKRNILTGLASIDLTGGTAKSPFRQHVPIGEDSPIVPEGRTELDTIADSIPGLVEDVGTLVSEVKHVFSPENRGKITNTLTNIESFSKDLAESGEDLEQLIKNFNELSQNLREVSNSLNSVLKGSDKKLQRALTSLDRALAKTEDTAVTINQESSRLSRQLRSAIDVLMVDINNVTKDISRAARSVSTAMDGLEDPRSIIAGPNERSLGPGERIPE